MARRWTDAPQRTRTRIQVGVLLVSVLVAYNYSLTTLLQTADQQTPLAYISLVPGHRPGPRGHPSPPAEARAADLRPPCRLHDRHSSDRWRPSPSTSCFRPGCRPCSGSTGSICSPCPIFVAGAVAIIFGSRVLWRQRLAILFLFLAWPYPYQKYLLGVLNAFTDAHPAGHAEDRRLDPSGQAGEFTGQHPVRRTHHGSTFALSVVSACSGVNGVVGFLLVGSAFAAIVRGPMVRKMLWLVGGMALLWVINLGRITFIFFAGKEWGEGVAINVFHPFIGLVTFSLGVLVMILLIKPLGMHIEIGEIDPSRVGARPPGTDAGSLAVRRRDRADARR